MNLLRKSRNTTTTATEGKTTMTSTTSQPRAGTRQRAAVGILVDKLDALDLGDLLADSRAALDRAQIIRNDFATANHSLREQYDRVRDAVIAADLTPADALAQLGALAPIAAKTEHVKNTLAQRLEDETVDAIETEAVALARRDAGKVHTALAERATAIATTAPEAAATLFDLDAYLDGIRRATDQSQWDSDRGCLSGWPRFDLSTVDPLRFGIVGTLRDLNARLHELHNIARVLVALDLSTASALYRTPPTDGVDSYVARWVPPELQLAVAARLGWTPGLWRTTDTKPRPGQRDTRTPRSGIPQSEFNEQIVRDVTRSAVTNVADQQLDARAGGALSGLASTARRLVGR